MVYKFYLKTGKDRTTLRRLGKHEHITELRPVKNTYRFSGRQLNRLKAGAVKLKAGRSELLRKLIEHYI